MSEVFQSEVTVTFSSTVKPKQHCRAELGSTVPVWATDAERWWLQEKKKKEKSQPLSDCGGIEATSKWQRGGAGGGRAPTSVHLSFICLISSDALPSRKGGTLGSHSISPPGFLTILWYWRRVILKDLLSHSQLYLEVGGSLGDPLGGKHPGGVLFLPSVCTSSASSFSLFCHDAGCSVVAIEAARKQNPPVNHPWDVNLFMGPYRQEIRGRLSCDLTGCLSRRAEVGTQWLDLAECLTRDSQGVIKCSLTLCW